MKDASAISPSSISSPASLYSQSSQLRKTLGLVTIAWLFGSVWANAIAGAPQTAFAEVLGASKFEFGVMAALPFMAALLSLPGSLLIERTGQRKWIFLIGLYFNRLMWIPIALVPIWLCRQSGKPTHDTMIVFLLLLFFMHTGQQVGGPAWTSWMADICPNRLRGRYFGRRRQWGILTAIPAALVAGWVLDQQVTPGSASSVMSWCAVIFIASAAFGVTDIAIFHWVPAVPQAPKKGAHLMAAWREPLRNPRFLWFAGFVATLIFAVSFMGQFATLYVMKQLGNAPGHPSVNKTTQLMLIVIPSLAQLLVLGIWGKAADRMGKRPMLILAGLGLVPVAVGWCFVTYQTIWLGYVLSALGAALWAGVEIANFNMVLEMSATNENGDNKGGTAYVAVNGVITSIAGCLGGLASGGVAQWLEDIHPQIPLIGTLTYFHVLFLLSAVLRLLAVLVFLPHVKEKNARPTVEVLRFMSSSFYNNLFGAAMLPLKVVGFRSSRPTRI